MDGEDSAADAAGRRPRDRILTRPISLGLLIAAAILFLIVALPAIRSTREQTFQE